MELQSEKLKYQVLFFCFYVLMVAEERKKEMTKRNLSPAAAKTELEKCLHCAAKPCQKACPAGCSPCDFIAAAKSGEWQKAALLIREQNPLGEICGLICPDRFCRKACLRAKIDYSVKIPELQAYIMKKAGETELIYPADKALKIAVAGTGPAGMAAAYVLLKSGCSVTFFEKDKIIGGVLNLIPDERLPREVITRTWDGLFQNKNVQINLNTAVSDFRSLLTSGFDGVVIAEGEQKYRCPGIEGEECFVPYTVYLRQPDIYACSGNVAVIGGGAVALDCAATARRLGAANVEMFVRRRLCDMRIDDSEYRELLEIKADVTAMTRVVKAVSQNGKICLYTVKTRFNAVGKLEDIPETVIPRPDFSLVISALGNERTETPFISPKVVYAGDCIKGSSTAVEAVASGKQAAEELLRILQTESNQPDRSL